MPHPVSLPSSSAPSRNIRIDALKGLACMAIVWHHLSAYGPLADGARSLAPGVMAWLYDYARMSVQVFLVVGGWLAASSLAPQGVACFASVATQIRRRFERLAIPYAAALVVAVASAALVRPWLDDPSVPDAPRLLQLLANALMLQDLLGWEALSAGVWYVAIDFQLFAMAGALLALARRYGGAHAALWGRGAVLALCAVSLLVFNRYSALDMWGVYFFGAYGLGMAAYWAAHSQRAWSWLVALALLVLCALGWHFRLRLVLAAGTAALLVTWVRLAAPWTGAGLQRLAAPLAWVGRCSYSVFLVHFSVCLVVNALFAQLLPAWPWVQASGLVLAFAASIAVGWRLYLHVERPAATGWRVLRWQARLLGAGLLVGLAQVA